MSKPDAKRRYRWRRAHRPLRAGDAGRAIAFTTAKAKTITLPAIGHLVRFTPIVNGQLGETLYPCGWCGKLNAQALCCADCSPF